MSTATFQLARQVFFLGLPGKLSPRFDADIWQIADVKLRSAVEFVAARFSAKLVIARKNGSSIRVARRRLFGELEVAARQLRYAMDLAGWAKPETASSKS